MKHGPTRKKNVSVFRVKSVFDQLLTDILMVNGVTSMAKPRSLLDDYLVYVVLRLFVCMIQALPFHIVPVLARGLAWLAYRVDRRHRLVAIDNLRHAFPGQFTSSQLDGLVRSTYRHF